MKTKKNAKKATIDKKVNDTAKSISDALNLGELNDKIDSLNEKLKSFKSKPKKSTSKTKRLFGPSDVSDTDTNELKKQPVEKRIVTFYQAALQNDTAVMKALAEGKHNALFKIGEFRKSPIQDNSEPSQYLNIGRCRDYEMK